MGKRKKNYHWNRRKCWRCPWFGWDGPDFLRCECGKPAFPDKNAANDYMTKYCAGAWEACSLAKARAEFEVNNEKERSNRITE